MTKLEHLAKTLHGLRADVILTSEPVPEGFDTRGNVWRCVLSFEETQSNEKTAPLSKTFAALERTNVPKEMRTRTYAKRRAMFVKFHTGSGIKTVPTGLDLLNSCLSDAQSVQWENFKGFCANCGYDEDSRKARKTHKACLKIARNLRRLLGERFEEFLNAEGL